MVRVVRVTDQPNFGFGFRAESADCNTFGILSVSVSALKVQIATVDDK